MLKVGLTGGIGSGKSLASEYFQKLGVPLIDADVISRQLLTTDSPTLKQVISQFGSRFLNQDGSLNRSKLRHEIFSDEAQRSLLESILHPAIKRQMLQLISQLQSTTYVILVVPLLIETDFKNLVDRVLVIDANKSHQIARVRQRDKQSASSVETIIMNQLNRESRLAAADDIITNNTTIDELQVAVQIQHQLYLNLASSN